jgi:peptidoglycan/xylan/chitin deacetylase (PgdA/CDA1 family)
MNRIRPLLRRAAYRAGGLGLMRERRRRALTVVMFHRVIDPADPDFADADPANTVSAPLFEEMLGFFRDNYAVVGLADLFAAAERARPLPDHSLLISFDDGWADNLRYAAPLLKSRGLPAVIFIAAEPVLSPAETWWQQQVFDAARRGTLAAACGREEPPAALDFVSRLAGLAGSERAQILASIPAHAPAARMMLAPRDLSSLAKFGIAIGIHGYRHLPLTEVADLDSGLRRARSAVASLSGDEASARALACPHGRYDQRVLTISREVGIRLVFTSDPILNPLDEGMIAKERPLGRISMEAPHLADRFGRLDRSAAATWLWRRPLAPADAPVRSLPSSVDAG